MYELELFAKLGTSLALGLLAGLQRERVQSRLAGSRTFALITVPGTVSALLGDRFGGWTVFAGSLLRTPAQKPG